MLHNNYKLLNCKENASKRKIEAIAKKSDLVLHPDKQGLIKWSQKKQIVLDSDTYHQCKAEVLEFWHVWKGTKDKLCEVGPGTYQNATCTHKHMISWHVRHIGQVN